MITIVVVAAFACQALGGCQSAEPAGPVPVDAPGTASATTPPPPAATDKTPPVARPLPSAPSVAEFEGKPCSSDGDCKFYLRCASARCTEPPALRGEGDASTAPAMSLSGSEGEAQFYLELATDDAERARGLMFRPQMSDAWGMLFVYPSEEELTFWMKNTFIPLDMVFIDDDATVVGVVHDAVPHTLTHRQVKGKSRYVLEINAGLAKRYGIESGSKVGFSRLPPAFAPRGR